MLVLGIICLIGWILGLMYAIKLFNSGGSDIGTIIGWFYGIVALGINALLWVAIFFIIGFFLK